MARKTKLAPNAAGTPTSPTPPGPQSAIAVPFPQQQGGMTFKEIGQSGLRAFAGYVREDYLPVLSGRQAARIYREMSDGDPTIGAMVYAINATMRKVEWRTNPADDTPAAQEMADFVDELRDDMSMTWEDVVLESLSMLVYGFAPQEIVYKRRLGRQPFGSPTPNSRYDDGRIGWRKMPIRGQDTVIKWFFGPNGEIEGLTQQPYVGPMVDIPMEKLLLFRPSQHKNNPEGRSILRNAYRPWYFVKRIEEQEAILYERLNGFPLIRVPSSLMESEAAGNPQAVATMAAYRKIAINLRVDEQMGMVLPSDTFPGANGPSSQYQYGFELVSPGGPSGGGKGVNANETVGRHQVNMLTTVMADFIQLGHGAHGSQALSVDKTDMFFQAIEGLLNANASVMNRYAIPRVWALNGLDPDLMPEVQPDLAQRLDLDVLGNYILRLSQAGMPLFPNDDLSTAILDAAGLPDITESEDYQDALDAQAQLTNPPVDPLTGQPDMSQTPIGKMILQSYLRRLHKHNGAPTRKRRRKPRRVEP